MDSPQYAVFHANKYKQLGGIDHHIDRLRLGCDPLKREPVEGIHHLLGSHIDPSRTHLNEDLVPRSGKSLSECVHARIEEGYRLDKGIRKDAVKAIGIMLTGSHERMKQKVVLAFHHDAAGQSMAEQVRSLVKEAGSVHVETPKKGKDWNELLQDSLRTDRKEVLHKLCKALSTSGQEHQLGHSKEMNVMGLDIEL